VSIVDALPLESDTPGARTLTAGVEDSITIPVTRRDGEHLQRLADENKLDVEIVDDIDGQRLAVVRSTDYAGVVGLPDSDSIYIQSKLENTALLRLLQLDETSEVETLEQFAQIEAGADFVDLLAGLYVDELAVVMRKGIERSYRRVTREEEYIRGQLNLHTQLQKSGPAAPEFHCTHDELTQDTPLNRTVLHAGRVLLRLAQDETIQQRLRRRVTELRRDVELTRVSRQEAEAITLDRMNEYYEHLLRLARLVIGNTFVDDLAAGDSLGYTLLLDMPDCYQSALLHPLRDVREDLTVTDEPRLQGFLTGEFDLTPRPDFVVKKDREPVLVADAKWKDIDRKPSESDIYQLISYQQYLQVPGLLLVPQDRTGLPLVTSATVENGHPLYVGRVPIHEPMNSFEAYRGRFVSRLRRIVDEIL